MSSESPDADSLAAELRARIDGCLAGKSFRLNPDQETVDNLMNAMVMRRQKKGDYYCPCRVVSNDAEQNRKIVCPCAFHEEEIAKDGHCKCWLFVQ